MTAEQPPFASDHVRVPITYADVVHLFNTASGQPGEPSYTFAPVRVPTASDKSAYAEYLRSGRYELDDAAVGRALAAGGFISTVPPVLGESGCDFVLPSRAGGQP